ncbi:MAG: hypothetical protein ACI9CE_001990 [Flavobacterium sp.]|jgi:hypothetical protein
MLGKKFRRLRGKSSGTPSSTSDRSMPLANRYISKDDYLSNPGWGSCIYVFVNGSKWDIPIWSCCTQCRPSCCCGSIGYSTFWRKAGIASLTICFCGAVLIGVLVTRGVLVYQFNITDYVVTPASWYIAIFSWAFVLIAIVFGMIVAL